MPRKDRTLNLSGFTLLKVTGKNPIYLHVRYRRKARCAHCHGKRLRIKCTFTRHIRHHMIARRKSYLVVSAHKFYCNDCQRYFNQRFEGIHKHQRSTEVLKDEVFKLHAYGVDQKALATNFGIGKATIERWYHRHYQLKNKHLSNQECPTVLGIDEHSFSKRQGYVTTLCDLRKHKVFDIVKGKSANSLEAFFNSLSGKHRVKVICIDLSRSYKSIIKKHFPNAKIVADRFHVSRLVNHMFLKAYQQIDPKLRYHRGYLGALRTNPDNLSKKQIKKRNEYLEKHPAMAAVYWFKQQLHDLLMIKHRTAKQCRKLIPKYLDSIAQLKNAPFDSLRTLAKTLLQWKEEIVRMWRFTKSNGITEGFHRKMKLIQRRAYGFRNFENYRIRVRVLCS